MPRWFALLGACLVLPALAPAQDTPAKAFTSADFEAFLKTTLKLEYEIEEDRP